MILMQYLLFISFMLMLITACRAPGEEAWPEQPFPVVPPPLARTGMSEEEVNDLTPEMYEYCRGLFEQATAGEIYTPVGFDYTITFPGFHGGSNWGGGAFDPLAGILYTAINNDGVYGRMIARDGDSFTNTPGRSPTSSWCSPFRSECQAPLLAIPCARKVTMNIFLARVVGAVSTQLSAY